MSLPFPTALPAGVGLQLATHRSPPETRAPRLGQFRRPPSHFHFVGAGRCPANTSGQVQVRFVLDLRGRREARQIGQQGLGWWNIGRRQQSQDKGSELLRELLRGGPDVL